jgi:hypothetical protein
MKKFMVLSLVGLLILAFGATGYAQQLWELEGGKPRPLPTMQAGNYAEAVVGEKPPVLEFKASGFIDVISEYNKNVNDVSPSAWTGATNLFGVSKQFQPLAQTPYAAVLLPGAAFNKTQAFMLGRSRLRFDAIMGKQVSGTIFFEIDATRWGEREGTGAQRNQAGHWNADAAAVEVKNMFISAAVPPIIPIPITVNAGILPWVTRPVCNYTDGTGINVTFKPDPAQIKLTWMKALENQDWASDDADVYGIEAKVNIGGFTVAGWMSYYNMNTYPFNLSSTSGNTWIGQANTAYMSTAIVNQTANMSWWGLYADGKLGPLNIGFDFVYDNGKVESKADLKATLAAQGRPTKVNYDGWITRLAVDFPIEWFNLGVVGMYASGSDMKKTGPTGYVGEAVAYGIANTYASKVSGYVIPPNAEHGYDDESIVYYGQGANGLGRPGTGFSCAGTGGASVGKGLYGGTWFAKLYGSFKPTPFYRVTVYGMYIGDTTKNGNSIGNAVDSTGHPRNDSTIGWELGLFNDIQIYKNLQFRFGAGVLFAGKAFDMWDQRNGTAPSYGGYQNVSPQNPWSIESKLLYVF